MKSVQHVLFWMIFYNNWNHILPTKIWFSPYEWHFLICRQQQSNISWVYSDFSVFYSSIAMSKLEPELRDSVRSKYGDAVQLVYFNKGLWWREGQESSSCFQLITLNFSSSDCCVMLAVLFFSIPLFPLLNQIEEQSRTRVVSITTFVSGTEPCRLKGPVLPLPASSGPVP